MKEYVVKTVAEMPDWSAVEKAEICEMPWGGSYKPETFCQIVYLQDRGFAVRMTCKEQNPRAVYTQPDDAVCQDSCMEFFADFAPDAGVGYLNLEANSLGTSLLGLGVERHGRKKLRALGCPLPTVETFREGEYWGWQGFIPLETVTMLWGKKAFAKGDSFTANMYKCGDKTEVEHYVVWNPIVSDHPDYHRPECFGKLIIG